MVKRKGGKPKPSGGSMSKMRGGFAGLFGGGKKSSKQADPKQFIYITAAIFVIFALIFFGTR